jgi:hypothetical protein
VTCQGKNKIILQKKKNEPKKEKVAKKDIKIII